MPVAELQNVTKRFANVIALNGASLTVESGELVSLLGPNGAGKTTAVRLLLGLSKPSAGAARIFGDDPRQRSARTQVGAMLQVAKVPDLLKVREHIALFSSYYPKPLPLAEIVEAAGLTGLENRLFGDLSGGQKQRVLFALAICGDPKLLFLDEPTVGMDIEARRALWRVIRGFVDRGGSVLLTTHYLEEADSLSDRVIVIDRGKVVAQGTPAQLKQANTGRRIKCVTRLPLDVIRATSGVRTVRQNGAALDIVSDSPEQTVRELLAMDQELSGLEVVSQALDDAFLSLVTSTQPEEVLQ